MSDCCPESELLDGTAQLQVDDDCTVIVEVEAGGPPGPQGPGASVAVGTTTTLAPGSPATVSNSGTPSAAIFDFGIPEGQTGSQGPQGATGSQGPGASIAIGTTTTLIPGSSASVVNSGTSNAAIFDFGIPEGQQGVQGPQGAAGQSTSFYPYKIRTTLTSGDPGHTHIIYNQASQITATQINISHIDDDNVDIDIFLELLKDNDVFVIQSIGNSNDFQKWEIIGTPTLQIGYVELPVALLSSGGVGTSNFGNNDQVILAISLVGPQGPQGSQGPVGPQGAVGSAATITVGSTSTLAPGSSATVTNSGTSSAAIFDFGIPEGVQGAQGPQGASITGPQGPQGITGIEVDATPPVDTSILWADTTEPGDMVVPAGGTTGQALVKVSGSDYDTTWGSVGENDQTILATQVFR